MLQAQAEPRPKYRPDKEKLGTAREALHASGGLGRARDISKLLLL